MFTAFLEMKNKNNNFIQPAVKSGAGEKKTCECNLTGFSSPRQSANYRNSFDVLNMKSDHRTKQLSANQHVPTAIHTSYQYLPVS